MNPVTQTVLSLPDHYNEQSEKAVLFLLLSNAELFKTEGKGIVRDDFYRDAHRQVFDTVAELADRGIPLELPTIVAEGRAKGRTEITPDMVSGLLIMPDGDPSVSNLPSLAEQLRTASTKRVAQDGLIRGLVYAKTEVGSTAQLTAFLENALTKIRNMETDDREATTMKRLLSNLCDEIDVRMANPNGILGIPSGFDKLDEITGGFMPGELIIVSGWTGRGKSTLVTQWAINAARSGTPAVVYSLEMTDRGIADRVAAMISGVEHGKIRKGRLSADERFRLLDSFGDYYELPFWHDFVGGMTARQICARAHVDRAIKKAGIVFVDHIGKVASEPSSRYGSREQEVSAMSGEFDKLADDLGIPVVLVSQMNRPFTPTGDVEEPTPSIHKLRDSGRLEQDSDVVVFTHRPYVKKAHEARITSGNWAMMEKAYLLVGKCRSGESDVPIPLVFDGKHSRFLSPDNLPEGAAVYEPAKA